MIETFRAEMLRLAQTLPEYPVVMAMYGVGDTPAPQLMAEIGDVRRFERKQSLVAFAEVDPEPNQSGTHNPTSKPTSKRGSPALRKTGAPNYHTYRDLLRPSNMCPLCSKRR